MSKIDTSMFGWLQHVFPCPPALCPCSPSIVEPRLKEDENVLFLFVHFFVLLLSSQHIPFFLYLLRLPVECSFCAQIADQQVATAKENRAEQDWVAGRQTCCAWEVQREQAIAPISPSRPN